jgi:hypothetical protein
MVRKTAKHVARNKKKYWRKISTQDIEDRLEDVRVQEMTGYVLRISALIYQTDIISNEVFVQSGIINLLNLILNYFRSSIRPDPIGDSLLISLKILDPIRNKIIYNSMFKKILLANKENQKPIGNTIRE